MTTRSAFTSILIAVSLLGGVAVSAHAEAPERLTAAHHATKQRATQTSNVSTPVLFTNTRVMQKSQPAKVERCQNRLVVTLKKVGFRGENLREAWAIAMRESHGHPRSISRTNDYGLFQLNRATFSGERWWNSHRLLKPRYNAKQAFRLSDGGRSWVLWGLDGHGNANPKVYRNAGWSKSQVNDWIVEPYQKYRGQFPC